jgi:hypothetical protein
LSGCSLTVKVTFPSDNRDAKKNNPGTAGPEDEENQA